MFKPRKVGWLDESWRRLHEGGRNCQKYLPPRGWNRKEGRGNKDFKKKGEGGSKLGQSLGALKRGLEPPYELCHDHFASYLRNQNFSKYEICIQQLI